MFANNLGTEMLKMIRDLEGDAEVDPDLPRNRDFPPVTCV
jgi:hypothetical protein